MKEERYYEENDDYRSCGIIERETHGQYDVCQDNVTGGYFVRKKVIMAWSVFQFCLNMHVNLLYLQCW